MQEKQSLADGGRSGLPAPARPRSCFFQAVPLILILAVVSRSPAEDAAPTGLAAPGASHPEVNPDGWTSSNVCGECHQAIHAVWRQSMHANAWSNSIFQAAYRRSRDAYGPEQAKTCQRCHTPTVRHGGDYDVKEAITAEGVTCDFCHSVSAVDLTDPDDPVRWTVGKTKYGPLRHAQSPAHEIVDTQLHTQSEFCAACHEYRNSNGVTVLGTYSEWKASPYAKQGKQCQDCHMPLIPGRVVALDVKRDTNKQVNLHDVSGSHDIEQVRKAVTLDLMGHEWLGDRVWVFVQVANEGSGHCFPTGLPKHRVVLEVTIHDGATLVDQRLIPFQIVMMNKDRKPLTADHEIMVESAYVRSDTRIKPKEKRVIDVSFRDVHASKLLLTATLYYAYSTETLVEVDGQERIEPAEMKFLIASRRNTIKPMGQ
ncbi:MAG: multiheme c-type cytochrome [Phycisphaerae bacterium]